MAAKAQGAPPAIASAPAELPPGFRFHPTDEELVNFYLKRKILLQVHDFIPEVDLYKCDPWDLQDKTFSPSRDDPGADGPEVECYLFGPRGQKYANGLRMNRATPAGFWKSTGKDRPILHHHAAIGMKKTLVYHLGRAPKGVHTDWVMHEYRLHHHDMLAIQDNYVLCRVFKKKAMAPSPDGAYVDKDNAQMQFDPSGAAADEDDALMQSMPSGAAVDTESAPMQFVPNVAAEDEEGASMHCEPNVAAAESEGASMQFEPRVGAADEEGASMQSVPSIAAADNELFKFLDDVDMDELQRFLDDEVAHVEVARVDDGAAGLELVGGGAEGGGQEE